MRKILFAYYLVRLAMFAVTAGFLYYEPADAGVSAKHAAGAHMKTLDAQSCLAPRANLASR